MSRRDNNMSRKTHAKENSTSMERRIIYTLCRRTNNALHCSYLQADILCWRTTYASPYSETALLLSGGPRPTQAKSTPEPRGGLSSRALRERARCVSPGNVRKGSV